MSNVRSRFSTWAAAVALLIIAATTMVDGVAAQSSSKDYDVDNDGLIEVADVAQLNAIRWDTDANGEVSAADQTNYSAAFPNAADGMGCPDSGCVGYELAADLDFDTNGNTIADSGDTYWNAGKGWDPFHFGVSGSQHRTFDGNGHTVSNLFIKNDQIDSGGLFDDVKSGATITDLRLANVHVDRSGISHSFSDGHAGGLAGIIHGSANKIAVSGIVHGVSVVGGLAGEYFGDTSDSISDIHIEATVKSTGVSGYHATVGGLVGIYRHGEISNSLVTGLIDSNVKGYRIGGIVGWGDPPRGLYVDDIYWDKQATTVNISAEGEGKTTAQLRAPTSATGIYANWSEDTWFFGTQYDYPRLRVGTIDYDVDNDRLIEVSDLGQLNAMRWDLDGNGASDSSSGDAGYAAAYFIPANGMGCPSRGCDGYELTTDLNFDTNGDGKTDVAGDRFWNDGEGWDPIGGGSSSGSSYFTTNLEGNGHVIRNLYIDRASTTNTRTGFLGRVSDYVDVNNLGFDLVNVSGYRYVGALAGVFDGNISGVYVTGDIEGHDKVGGIVGSLQGSISKSFFDGDVAGDTSVGGLVGTVAPVTTAGHEIENSYATGTVRGGNLAAGLVAHMGLGVNGGLNSVSNSYSAAEVTGWKGSSQSLAGLVGSANATTELDCSDSYWDTTASGRTNSACGVGKTSAELKAPTSATGIYSDWDAEVWDFGHQLEYPALKVDFNGDGVATWIEFGNQDRLGLPPSDSLPAVAPIIKGYNVELGTTVSDLGKTSVYVKPDVKDDVTALAYRIADATGDEDISCVSWRSFGPEEVDDNWSIIAPYTTGTPVELPGEFYGGHPGTVVINHADVEIGRVFAFCLQLASANSEGRGPAVQEIIELPYTDYDLDDDGLIEVANLAQLNAMRWDLNSDGSVVTADQANYAKAFSDAANGMGCPTSGCSGYELSADLDFDTNHNGIADAGDAYWNNGDGWQPIGTHTSWVDPSTEFHGTFDGDGHVIRNLFIDRTGAGVGLFGWTDRLSVLENVGLEDADVTGGDYTGGLVGGHEGDLTGVYVTGKVSGNDHVGGLAGFISLDGKIDTVYSTADVSGNNYVGGVVGNVNSSSLTSNVYAAGSVNGNSNVGGLSGHYVHESMSNSYSTASVSGNAKTGGLIGSVGSGKADESYWDTQTSGQSGSASGIGRTTSQLQGPTSNTGIYLQWSTDIWDFGTSLQYPALKADFNGDGKATSGEFGNQRGDYDADDDGLIEVENLAQLNAIRWDLNGDGVVDDSANHAKYLDAFRKPEERMGCPSSGCDGYELSFDLNFDTNDNGHADDGDVYWNGGAGWSPIDGYSGVLDGNGRAIENLYVNRTERGRSGLFSHLTNGAVVRNLGLVNVEITSNGDAGAFAGLTTRAAIYNSYATGLVMIHSNNDSVGGFVGEASGHPYGLDSIRDSYSVVNVTAVGEGNRAGGLVGSMHVNQSSYTQIVNSYAAGMVRSKDINQTGGLVGKTGTPQSSITGSYWDTETTGWHTSANDGDGKADDGVGKTSAELESPTSATGIYADWSTAWDFGTASEYPALKYDTNGDGTATVAEFGYQLRTADAFIHDLDLDEDGLIEVSTLDQLNAIRWDEEGDGVAGDGDTTEYANAFARWRTGLAAECVGTKCVGYELTVDLDFDTDGSGKADPGDAYWNDGEGWWPIANFTGVFEGNGRAIKNLYVDMTYEDLAGLFGRLTDGAEVRNVALTNVDVTSWSNAGAIAGGMIGAAISNSYATGSVTVLASASGFAGGLVGGALGHPVGKDTIRDSYSLVEVTAKGKAVSTGGLVGRLFAYGDSQPQIVNSFAAGLVQTTRPDWGGGLVGQATDLTWALNSYWDRQTTGWETSAAGWSQSQERLQRPTSASNIYHRWSSSVWDFGSNSEYPALKYDTDGDGTATAAEFGDQVRTATIPDVDLDRDNDGLIEINNIDTRAKLNAIRWDLDGDGTPRSGNASNFWSVFNDGNEAAVPCVGALCRGYELTWDVDLGGDDNEWYPLGHSAEHPFSGEFNGNGHTISNLWQSRTSGEESNSHAGLFGFTGSDALIHGVILNDVDIEVWGSETDDNSVNVAGALVAVNRGTVRNSALEKSDCDVVGRNVAGGLVGANHGTVEQSWADCKWVKSFKSSGGLVGYNHSGAKVLRTYVGSSSVAYNPESGWYKGALVGRNFGNVGESYSLGKTRRNSSNYGPLNGQQAGDGATHGSFFFGKDGHQELGGEVVNEDEMKTPDDDDPGIFGFWDNTLRGEWDFGDDTQYNALRVDTNGDGYTTPWELGSQRHADSFAHRPNFEDGDAAHSVWREALSLRFRKSDDDANRKVDGVGYRIAKTGSACHDWLAPSEVMLDETNGRATLSEDNDVYTLVLNRANSWALRPNGRVCIDVWFINAEGEKSDGRRWHDIHMPPVDAPRSKPIKAADAEVEPGKVTLAFRTDPNDRVTSVDYRIAHQGDSCTKWGDSSAAFKPGEVLDGAVLNQVGSLWRLELPVGEGHDMKPNRRYCVDVTAHNDAGAASSGRRWRDFLTVE